MTYLRPEMPASTGVFATLGMPSGATIDGSTSACAMVTGRGSTLASSVARSRSDFSNCGMIATASATFVLASLVHAEPLHELDEDGREL
jgi:hypothetical protein